MVASLARPAIPSRHSACMSRARPIPPLHHPQSLGRACQQGPAPPAHFWRRRLPSRRSRPGPCAQQLARCCAVLCTGSPHIRRARPAPPQAPVLAAWAVSQCTARTQAVRDPAINKKQDASWQHEGQQGPTAGWPAADCTLGSRRRRPRQHSHRTHRRHTSKVHVPPSTMDRPGSKKTEQPQEYCNERSRTSLSENSPDDVAAAAAACSTSARATICRSIRSLLGLRCWCRGRAAGQDRCRCTPAGAW